MRKFTCIRDVLFIVRRQSELLFPKRMRSTSQLLERGLRQDQTILGQLQFNRTPLQVQSPWAVRLRESHHIENFIGLQYQTTSVSNPELTLLWG